MAGPLKYVARMRQAVWAEVEYREYRTRREADEAAARFRLQYPKPYRVRQGSYKFGSFADPKRSYTVRVYQSR